MMINVIQKICQVVTRWWELTYFSNRKALNIYRITNWGHFFIYYGDTVIQNILLALIFSRCLELSAQLPVKFQDDRYFNFRSCGIESIKGLTAHINITFCSELVCTLSRDRKSSYFSMIRGVLSQMWLVDFHELLFPHTWCILSSFKWICQRDTVHLNSQGA